MTSTPVMGSEILLNVNFMNQTSRNSKMDLGSFKDFMKQSTESVGTSSNVKKQDNVLNKKMSNENPAIQQKVDNKSTQITKTSESTVENENEAVNEVADAIEEVKDVIKEELDVTDEEIAEALSTLGLTFAALLDTEMLPKVVAELTNSEDTLSIVTNQELYDSLSNILETVETVVDELSENLEIPVKELETAIKQFELPKEELTETHDFEEGSLAPVEIKAPEREEVLEEKITIEDNRDQKKTVDSNKDSKVDITTKETADNTTEKTAVSKSEFKKETGSESREGSRDNSLTGFVNRIIEKAVESLESENGVESFTTFDPKNVLNQITESIKFNLTNDVNEVNLRLHPETLGTVNVKVTTNAQGIMTAQFTAQNEQVKAVIENQAVILRETLEAKGVTVEAVEVLVQSHEFERNLDEQNRGQESNGKGTKRARRINLADDLDDEASGEDTVIREMMIQNGNTIDYSA